MLVYQRVTRKSIKQPKSIKTDFITPVRLLDKISPMLADYIRMLVFKNPSPANIP
jgi:hypothetical protein